jgi:hypothetical protein
MVIIVHFIRMTYNNFKNLTESVHDSGQVALLPTQGLKNPILPFCDAIAFDLHFLRSLKDSLVMAALA